MTNNKTEADKHIEDVKIEVQIIAEDVQIQAGKLHAVTKNIRTIFKTANDA